ncbi:MAG: hypothetical protein ACRDHD_00765 [Candidatus Limnocylindria bacterium]
MKRVALAALLASALTISVASVASAHDESTCSNLFGYPHGYHIVADYVTGLGSEFLGGAGIAWPPREVNASGGAALPGGPGPAFHFVLGVAPGASFCNDSNSPGAHF